MMDSDPKTVARHYRLRNDPVFCTLASMLASAMRENSISISDVVDAAIMAAEMNQEAEIRHHMNGR